MTHREQCAPVRWAPVRIDLTKWALKFPSQRSIFRWIHIVLSIPILGYIYSPFDQIPNYAPVTRFFFVPVMVLSGLWMWKGHVLLRLLSKRPA